MRDIFLSRVSRMRCAPTGGNSQPAAHPDQNNRPVIEVLYLEMALPNL